MATDLAIATCHRCSWVELELVLAFYFVNGIFLEFGLVAFWADLNTALVMAFHECLAFRLAIATYPCLFRVELELVLTIRVGA